MHAGEIVGLAGLIGSGRSELAQAIFGTLPPESGTIEIEGRSVNIRGPEDAIRLGIAYVPEDRGRQGLITAMNVGQNVAMTRLKQLTRGPFLDFKAEKTLAEDYVARLRIKTPNVRETVRNLSGGNQQKIVVAKWLATKPRILIVDEPTRGIDVGARAEIHRLIVSLARDEGLAVVVISSDMQEVLRLADRILVMHEGRITGEFTRAKATQESVLTAAFGNRGTDENDSWPTQHECCCPSPRTPLRREGPSGRNPMGGLSRPTGGGSRHCGVIRCCRCHLGKSGFS